MRIISGSARGRKLKDVTINIRPTGDMIKESIFNIIQFDIEGRKILDLFAGCGQLGIEALSRGAESAVFVDSNPGAIKLISQNLRLCGFSDVSNLRNIDAIKYLEKNTQDGSFDIIFIDPPYDTSLLSEAMEAVIKFDKLNRNGIIICETSINSLVPTASEPYVFIKEYKYGSTKILRYDRLSD